MKQRKFRLNLFVAQYVTREIYAVSAEEAEKKGYEMIEGMIECKSINPDVTVDEIKL